MLMLTSKLIHQRAACSLNVKGGGETKCELH